MKKQLGIHNLGVFRRDQNSLLNAFDVIKKSQIRIENIAFKITVSLAKAHQDQLFK